MKTNFISHGTAEFGVGEISRRLMALLSAAGLDLNPVLFEMNKSRNQHPLTRKTSGFLDRSPTISSVNADQLGAAIANFQINSGPVFHIGFWSWELEDFPDKFAPASNLLDEIWTLSKFAENSISKTISTTVRAVKVPVPIPSSTTTLRRGDLGIPENSFLITSSFDFDSDIDRKNPAGSIAAFIKAFPKPTSAVLILKSINGERHVTEFARLRDQANNRKDIIFLDGFLGHYENKGLLEISDVYLSLHRSEGYGLNLADAMARGTAVIATGYSGNLDFMDENSSILVPFKKIPVTKYAGINVNSNWADPDVDFAADKLRKLSDTPTLVQAIASKAFTKIKNENSLSIVVKKFQKEFMNA